MLGEWIDVYPWCVGGIALKEWRDKLARTAPESYTEVDKAKEENTQW